MKRFSRYVKSGYGGLAALAFARAARCGSLGSPLNAQPLGLRRGPMTLTMSTEVSGGLHMR